MAPLSESASITVMSPWILGQLFITTARRALVWQPATTSRRMPFLVQALLDRRPGNHPSARPHGTQMSQSFFRQMTWARL